MNETANEDPVIARSRIDQSTLPPDGGERYNRLIFEKSPYLLQHAEDPVDWHPWGKDAFDKARREDKPIFLSIGYSTCHWCHVMAEESFADPAVADLLNDHFVAIKVDREERPDIDRDYMTVCQLLTGSGGWPLTLVLTPDKAPFFAATYLPRVPRGTQPGIIAVLERLAELWHSERQRLNDAGRQAATAVGRLDAPLPASLPLDETPLRNALVRYREEFDADHGGFGTAPKFPAPHNLSLLLRLGQRFSDAEATDMALKSFQALRLGGIYDHVGFGLHRYAVDAAWRIPHFEKMLYDQAQFVLAGIEAYQVSGAPLFAQSAREVLDYLSRKLTDRDGGFYCGEDADSQGAEGTFYLWTPAEVEAILGRELATVFCLSYGITERGNFEGKNVPHLAQDLDALAA
ncbi:MAG TPA: thioredoxin domain-containing protein, partial [Desulfuromonadales bacterium]|nr:thioredoxin domain-containing protein [Desulfuromonadales bacterium]